MINFRPLLEQLTFWLLILLLTGICCASSVMPVGEPVLDPPTLRCLGVYWVLQDEEGATAKVEVAYRKVGETGWKPGPNLFRAERGPFKGEGGRPKPLAVLLPAGAHLYAGSVFLLEPDTAYQLRLTLHQGGNATVQKTLLARTIGEPVTPPGMKERHVVPGNGGGTGAKSDPFRGLQAANSAAKPGDLLLLHAGRYDAPIVIRSSGEPGKPIIWRGAGDGETILDAKQPHEKLTVHVLDARERHDVWFEKLTLCNAYSAICAHASERIVVRRCHIHDVLCGVYAVKDDTGLLGGLFISDNTIEGFMPWPVTDKQWHELPESRAIWISGQGNVACYNRISRCKDGLDLDDCRACVSNDFHNNDVFDVFDDGSEMDGSDRNTRNFYNRYTNVLCGISFQPVCGGPVYAFRNVIYNIRNEPFKLHNSPSGAVIVHNTTARAGVAMQINTSDSFSNCYLRNNLLVGTSGRAFDSSAVNPNCDWDYDGFAGWSGDVFFKWDGVKYASPEEVKAKCPVERHILNFDPTALFMNGTRAPQSDLTVFDPVKLDLRLKRDSPAIDKGEPLPGFDDGYTGFAPDLGAYEYGVEPPHYGPRPETKL